MIGVFISEHLLYLCIKFFLDAGRAAAMRTLLKALNMDLFE
jgi:hypothetical protein